MTVFTGIYAILVCELAPHVALLCHTPEGPVVLSLDDADGVDVGLLYCVVAA